MNCPSVSLRSRSGLCSWSSRYVRALFLNLSISQTMRQKLGFSMLVFCAKRLDIPLPFPHSHPPPPPLDCVLTEKDMSDLSISTPSPSNHSIMWRYVTLGGYPIATTSSRPRLSLLFSEPDGACFKRRGAGRCSRRRQRAARGNGGCRGAPRPTGTRDAAGPPAEVGEGTEAALGKPRRRRRLSCDGGSRRRHGTPCRGGGNGSREAPAAAPLRPAAARLTAEAEDH